MPFTVKEAAEALRLGTITSAELTKALFAKIDALDPTVGAFITLTPEVAMAEAQERTFIGTRRYVRRQRSWFRRDHRITWLAGDADGNAAEVARIWRHVR